LPWEKFLIDLEKIWQFYQDINKKSDKLFIWNELLGKFFSFIYKESKNLDYILDFEKELEDITEIDVLYSLYSLLNWYNVEAEVHNNFILVFVWEMIFTFVFEPSFKVLNEVLLYLSEWEKKYKKHIFFFTHINFFSYLTAHFKKRINLSWLNQVFAKLMLYSYYDPEVSDWTITWSKSMNIAYILVRKNGTYKVFWLKKWWVIQTTFSYSMMEETINNIIMLGWNISWWKQADTSITFGWIKYRLGIWKDWVRTTIVARRNWFAWVEVDLFKLMEDEWLVLLVRSLAYEPEQFTLRQTYMDEDVKIFLKHANAKKWLFIISWQTWSWKSVSMRNLLNYVFEKAKQDWYYRKIWTFEDPIEVENINFCQLEATKEELPLMLLFIKRWDFDDALVWEIRNYEMLPWILEASETISTYTTSHQASVASGFLILKNWATQAKIDFIDVLNALKVYDVESLWKVINYKYHWKENRNILLNDKKIKLIDNNKFEEIWKEFYWLFDSYIWKDLPLRHVLKEYDEKNLKFKNMNWAKDVLNKKWEDYVNFVIETINSMFLFKRLLEKAIKDEILLFNMHDSVRSRKKFYEYIERTQIKSNYSVILQAYTWEWNEKLTFEERDPEKLMNKLMKHTKEEMWILFFLRWVVPYENLFEDFNPANFVWSIIKMFRKNDIINYQTLDNFYNTNIKW